MKVSYFGYVMVNPRTGDRWLVDLRQLVSRFVAWPNPAFKSQITYNGEQLFLLPAVAPVYLFVQARDREIIKAIEKQKLSVKDIHSALNGESVGFASYVLMNKYWFGIGCRVLSPRVAAFAHFMQQMLDGLALPYQFVPQALTQSLPKSDVQKLHEVSSVTIEMSVDNGIGADVFNLVTGGGSKGIDDVGTIEVILRRRRKGKRNLLGALKGVVDTVPDSGLDALDARARREATDQMTDVYIVGQGGVRDTIDVDSEDDIAADMIERASANAVLAAKVGEMLSNDKFKTASSPRDLRLDWQPPGGGGRTIPAKRQG